MTIEASLLDKVAKRIASPADDAPTGVKASILAVAAGSYGARPRDEEVTVPTGFDPNAAALFEAIVEAAYLVATADGELDETEREAFGRVVAQACHGAVSEDQIGALLSDLADQLAEDGLEKRIEMVGRTIAKEEHQREVLRIAGFLASISGGVSDVERRVLEAMAEAFGLESGAVEAELQRVAIALDV